MARGPIERQDQLMLILRALAVISVLALAAWYSSALPPSVPSVFDDATEQ